jgi:SAM-dependent methyltransferase
VPRPDVGDAFPALRANNPLPGFRAVVSTLALSDGPHELTLVERTGGTERVLARAAFRVQNSARDFLAYRSLTGSGLEIGALQRPLAVPGSCRVRYVDRMDVKGLREHYPGLRDLPLVPVDIIDDGETLQSVEPASQDFIIASHFLEHTQDPIGTLSRFLELLKPGGVLYLAVPDKRFTFDINRPVTPLEHVYRDYEEGPAWSYLDHVREWVEVRWGMTGAAAEAEIKRIVDINFSIHFHVWTQAEYLELLIDVRRRLGLPFRIQSLQSEGNEVISVLRKSAA